MSTARATRPMRAARGPALLLLCAMFAGQAVAATPDPAIADMVRRDAIAAHVYALSALPSRVPGYPGSTDAVAYVKNALETLGYAVELEPFKVAVPVEEESSVELPDGTLLPIHALWPNHVRTSQTPAAGLRGPLVDAGDGRYEAYDGSIVDGSIVLMEFESGERWLNAAMLGARAVLFVEPPLAARFETERKLAVLPMSVPRFWVSRDVAATLRDSPPGGEVVVRCRMPWRKIETYNIVARLDGADPAYADSPLVIESYYDSMSVVPAIAPGATQACGVSAWLEIARIFRERPGPRPVIFVAAGAHHLRTAGAIEYLHRHMRTALPFNELTLREPIKNAIVAAIDLSDDNDMVALWHRDPFVFWKNNPKIDQYFSRHAERFAEYAEQLSTHLGRPARRLYMNLVRPERGADWHSFLPWDLAFDGTLFTLANTPAINLFTAEDVRPLADSPHDTAGAVDVDAVYRQTRFLAASLHAFAAEPDLPGLGGDKLDLPEEVCTFKGRIVTFDPRKSVIPDDPVAGGIGVLQVGTQRSYAGVRSTFVDMADTNGTFFIHGCYNMGAREAGGYAFDADSGDIILAADRGIEGNERFPLAVVFDWRLKEQTVVLFKARAMELYDLIDPRYLVEMDQISIFDAGNSQPFAYGYDFPPAAIAARDSSAHPYGIVYGAPDERVKIGLGSSILGLRVLLLNSPSSERAREAEGLGFVIGDTPRIAEASYVAARDMFHLNEFRMRALRQTGVRNERLSSLHERAAEHLEAAAAARDARSWDNFVREARAALAIESRAYPDVKGTANDVVKGVVFYMALILPFAFFGERLIFTFADVRMRIVGVAGIFLAVYLALRWVHPAFRISGAPEVILLAVVILALSTMVIFIASGRFEEQMKQMKLARQRVHSADVGRVGAAYTAFMLGVSNMKRRKVRTALTCVTILLLMFIVLSFTSVRTYLSSNRIPRTYKPSYAGAMLRDRNWRAVKTSALDHILSAFEPVGTVAPRSWLISPAEGQQLTLNVWLAGRENVSGPANATGLVGLSAAEPAVSGLDATLRAGRWFEPGEENVCLLPDAMAGDLLGIDPDDPGEAQVRILGQTLRVVGILDAAQLEAFRDLDGEQITPANFLTMSREEQRQMYGGLQGSEMEGRKPLRSFVHEDPRNTVFVPFQHAVDLGGTVQSVAVRFHDGENEQHVQDFISRLAVTMFTEVDGTVFVYSALAKSSVEGMRNVFIPIVLAALIVLNTMMGSVHERFREIGIYSSVGLAPVHVTALFLAESCVFAVLGGIGGYLFGQVVAKAITATGHLGGLTLNYSSLSAVHSTLVVMGTVLLSTLYPARKAAQMAVPDVTRQWVLPPPEGDEWRFEFPFTLPRREVAGLYRFFHYFFASHEDQSIAEFYTSGTTLQAEPAADGQRSFVLRMRVWLAPFDLGISQDVEMQAMPTGDRDVYQIQMKLVRVSGEFTAWSRVNRRFLDALRKQFLIWRTIAPEGKEEYSREALELLGADVPGSEP